MDHKKVMVTGGAGFIGACLVRKLLDKGHHVSVFDNEFRGSIKRLEDVLDNIDYIKGDITDAGQVMQAFEGIDIVYHLAAVNGTRHFYEIPERVLEVGVYGCLNTLNASIKHEVERYILASSSEVYQTPSKVPTDESERIMLEDIKNPRYSYAGGKIISEILTLNYLRKQKTEAVIFRPHNIFGPEMGWEHVIPEILVKISSASNNFKDKQIQIQIQGDGSQTRAFCYVENAVEEILLCAEKGNDGEIYHIGEMQEISILSLIKIIGKILDMQIDVRPGDLPAGGTVRRCPDIGKIRSLGFVAGYTFEQGLEKTIQYYRQEILERHLG